MTEKRPVNTWMLCLDSLREVDFEQRRIKRIAGSVPATKREGDSWRSFANIGSQQAFENDGTVGVPAPGDSLLIIWSVADGHVKATRGSTLIAALETNPAVGSWAWDEDPDQSVTYLTFDGDRKAVTVKPEAGHVLACLLNWAATITTAAAIDGAWGTARVDNGEDAPVMLTAASHPVAGFTDLADAEVCATLLNVLPDQMNTTMGAIAAVSEMSGWGNPQPVWALDDIAPCRQALLNAGLTPHDVGRIEVEGEDRLREAARITSLVAEHLSWADTGFWWHRPVAGRETTPLEAFLARDDAVLGVGVTEAADAGAELSVGNEQR